MDLNGKKIAILATNGFEQSELETPRGRLKRAGCRFPLRFDPGFPLRSDPA
jgi:putative intracellular protease/amidase